MYSAASSAKGLTGNLRATGEQLVHWYTQDWVVRRRKCTTCAHASTTIELHAEDFRAIVKEGLPMMNEPPMRMRYTNWRGETADRVVLPSRVWFGRTAWHSEPQWLMTALDMESGQVRDFAMSGIQRIEPTRARDIATDTSRAQIAALGGSK